VLLGWVCAEPGVLHWAYVRHEARRNGILSALLAPLQHGMRRITHRPGKHLRAKAHAMGLRYEPLTLGEIDHGDSTGAA
jgi:hypothetical protein